MNTSSLALLVGAACLVTAPALLSASDARPARLGVFVRSTSSEGFTDPSKDRQDSIKDLQKQIKDSDWVCPVESEADAVVVLEVLSRDTKRETNGWSAFNGQRQNKSSVTVRLTAGTFSTEFTGESNSRGMMKGYGNAAGKVIKQVEEWVQANRARLVANDGGR